MSDIVERLRAENERKRDAGGDMLYRGPSDPLLTEAADTITDLRAEVERLREALERIIDRSMNDPIGTSKVIDMREIARAALTQTKDTTDDA